MGYAKRRPFETEDDGKPETVVYLPRYDDLPATTKFSCLVDSTLVSSRLNKKISILKLINAVIKISSALGAQFTK